MEKDSVRYFWWGSETLIRKWNDPYGLVFRWEPENKPSKNANQAENVFIQT